MEKELKLILIDDNENFCHLISEHLAKQENMEVIATANNGEQGIELIREKEPDLLLLDIIMPELDGLGVMEKINEYNLDEDMYVIILTAFGQKDMTHQLVELGADYYIMKPFGLNMLTKRIEQVVYHKENEELEAKKENILAEREHNDNYEVQKKDSRQEKDLNAQITEVLHKLGVPVHIKGYLYLRKSIELVIKNVELIGAVTKKLYPRVAEEFNTTPNRVERAIRHAIEVTWKRGDISVLNEYFGATVSPNSGKATNSQFIAKIADKFRIEMNIT
ncbi:MAG: sporulation transcription factor Spo0A [Halanaerobiaceae bacterium]